MEKSHPPMQMFDFLDETHQEIQTNLNRLKEIIDHVCQFGTISTHVDDLNLICNFFSKTVRNHHLDEELHVFPSLIASSDEQLRSITRQLYQDHFWLESSWMELCPMLKGLIDQNNWYSIEELDHSFNLFKNLNLEHLKLEESIAYPGAIRSIWSWDEVGIGREMSSRRKFRKSSLSIN
jgi:hemerythrin-like domain-containing protein